QGSVAGVDGPRHAAHGRRAARRRRTGLARAASDARGRDPHAAPGAVFPCQRAGGARRRPPRRAYLAWRAAGGPGMRVLIACPSYPPQDVTCGVGDYARCLAEELARLGEQVTVVASKAWRGPERGGVAVSPILDEPAPWWRVIPTDVVSLQYAPDLWRGRTRALRVTLSMPTVVTLHTLTDATLRSSAV